MRTKVGAVTIACAAVDDVTAWCILAVVIAVVRAGEATMPLWLTLAGSLVYVGVMLFPVRKALAWLEKYYHTRGMLTRDMIIVVLLLIGAWLMSGLYRVQPAEQGVFGHDAGVVRGAGRSGDGLHQVVDVQSSLDLLQGAAVRHDREGELLRLGDPLRDDGHQDGVVRVDHLQRMLVPAKLQPASELDSSSTGSAIFLALLGVGLTAAVAGDGAGRALAGADSGGRLIPACSAGRRSSKRCVFSGLRRSSCRLGSTAPGLAARILQ